MTKETKIAGLTGREMAEISAKHSAETISEAMDLMGYISTVQDGTPGRLYKDGHFEPYEDTTSTSSAGQIVGD